MDVWRGRKREREECRRISVMCVVVNELIKSVLSTCTKINECKNSLDLNDKSLFGLVFWSLFR